MDMPPDRDRETIFEANVSLGFVIATGLAIAYAFALLFI